MLTLSGSLHFLSIRRRTAALLRALAVLCAVLLTLGTSVAADAQTTDVQTAWRLLDYMAVDYGGAVSGGQVKSRRRICRDDRIRGLGIGSPIDAAARAGARAADRGRSSTSEGYRRERDARRRSPASPMASPPICSRPIPCRSRRARRPTSPAAPRCSRRIARAATA
jgi:hypothetical protein